MRINFLDNKIINEFKIVSIIKLISFIREAQRNGFFCEKPVYK